MSFSLYLYDTEDRRWRRPWARMLPPGWREVEIRDHRFMDGGAAAGDGVVVVHASRLPEATARDQLLVTAAAARLSLILISGGHQDGPGLGAHVYRRRRPVRVREEDTEFRRCFSRFWESLQASGALRFELLEPARNQMEVVTLLCQGYLLAHAAAGPAGWASIPAPLRDAAGAALGRLQGDPQTDSGRAGAPAWSGAPPPPGMLEAVQAPAWWDAVEPAALRADLARAGLAQSAALIALMEARQTGLAPTAAQVISVYLDLEGHLRRGR